MRCRSWRRKTGCFRVGRFTPCSLPAMAPGPSLKVCCGCAIGMSLGRHCSPGNNTVARCSTAPLIPHSFLRCSLGVYVGTSSRKRQQHVDKVGPCLLSNHTASSITECWWPAVWYQNHLGNRKTVISSQCHGQTVWGEASP